MKHLATILAAAAAIAVASPAAATTTIDFESATPGVQPNPLTIEDATFSSTGDGLYVGTFTGSTGLEVCSYTGPYCDAQLDVGFSGPIDDFSFLYDGVDVATSTLSVFLTFAGGGTSLFTTTGLVNGSVVDLTAYSDILSASIWSDDPAGLSYDNFTYTLATPEPATWGMMLLGFALAGSALRRRKRLPATVLA